MRIINTSNSQIVKKLIIDFIPVFIGVILGVLVSTINERNKEEEFLEKAVKNIYSDNQNTIKDLDKQIKHYKAHLDTIKKHQNDTTINIMELVIKNNGLKYEPPVFTGWKIVKSSQQVSNLDYEVVSILTYIEEHLQFISDKIDAIADLLYTSPQVNNNNYKTRLLIIFYDLYGSTKGFKKSSMKLDSVLRLKHPKILKEEIDSTYSFNSIDSINLK